MPPYAAMKSGQPYNGAADILDAAYFTSYFPIVDPSSKVIGILFAGAKQSHAYELAAALERDILLTSAA